MIVALIVALTVLILYERTRPLVNRWLKNQQPARAPEGAELPHDLKMIALSESEPFAKADTELRFRELYERLGSWDAVRQYVTPGSDGSASRR